MGMFVLKQAPWSGNSSFQLYCESLLQLVIFPFVKLYVLHSIGQRVYKYDEIVFLNLFSGHGSG